MPEQAIFTNLCMITDNQGNILVQDRIKADWPGISFPGGHVEPGESFVNSVIREVKEETGLDIQNPILCGIKQFQTEDNSRYVDLFYKTSSYSGQLTSSNEGNVFWIPRSKLPRCKLGLDFEEMLQIFECDTLSEFYYYKDDNTWRFSLL